jgi:hypothetical protein
MCIFWLRGQDLLKTLPLKSGYKGALVTVFYLNSSHSVTGEPTAPISRQVGHRTGQSKQISATVANYRLTERVMPFQ